MSEQVTSLIDKLRKGRQVYDEFAQEAKKELYISGHPPEHWEKRFKIHIQTDNLTPAICLQLDLQLLELTQEASFYHAVCSANCQLIKRASDEKYKDKFYSLVQEYKTKNEKLPAAATLETIARIESQGTAMAEDIAEMQRNFWKDILEHLHTCRKIVENATWNISNETKALNNNFRSE